MTWRLSMQNGKMLLSVPRKRSINKAIRENFKTRLVDDSWTFNPRVETAQQLSKMAKSFEDRLTLSKKAADWIRNENSCIEKMLSPGDLEADTSHMLPRLRWVNEFTRNAMSAMPWQLYGAEFICENKVALLADKPGLGKTLQVLAALEEANVNGPQLIIAPRTAVNVTWPDEIMQWLNEDQKIFKINSDLKPAQRRDLVREAIDYTNDGSRAFVICGPNYLRLRPDLDDRGRYIYDDQNRKVVRTVGEAIPELFGIKWSSIILDESHLTVAGSRGNPKSQSAQRYGLMSLKQVDDGIRVAISGTPFRGKTENLWGTLNWLQPEAYRSYWKWIERHYGMVDNYSGYGPDKVKGDEVINERAFFEELRPIMIRRTKKEVAKYMPAKMYCGTHLIPGDENSPIGVWLPMEPVQAKQYDQILREAVVNLDDDEITVNGVFAQLIRLKQVANSAIDFNKTTDKYDVIPKAPSNKLNWIEEFLIERQSSGEKVIVVSQFTKFLNMVSDHLKNKKIGHYLFTGETKNDEREEIKRLFQRDDGELFILLNLKSGGVSLSLDEADDVVMCDQTRVQDDQEQAEDRGDRLTRILKGKQGLRIWYLNSLGTVDEDTMVINNRAEQQMTSILDGQRGINFTKEILLATKARAAS